MCHLVGKKTDMPDAVVAPANSIHDEAIDCVDAETALLPAVPDESQSPAATEVATASSTGSLDMQVDELHSTSVLLASSLVCPFLTSVANGATSSQDCSAEQTQKVNCSSSSYLPSSEPDGEDEMATDEQLEDWDSEVFDP